MTHLFLAISLEVTHAQGSGDLTEKRPSLAAWLRPIFRDVFAARNSAIVHCLVPA
jgi:hypothetical protein